MKKPITCAAAGRKGGKARSEAKTAANRKNARQPRYWPKTGQVWRWITYRTINRTTEVSGVNVTFTDTVFQAEYYISIKDWIAERKSGYIKIVKKGAK